MLLAALAATGTIAVLFLRSMGVTRDHPRIRQLSSRPWRDGKAVLRLAVGHLHDVFVMTPSGALFAPNSVDIQMNPEDLASLCERMELDVVTASVTEAYEERVYRYGARFATAERPEVYVVGDDRIPRGRYRLRHGHLATAAAHREVPADGYSVDPEPEFAYAAPLHAAADTDGRITDGRTRREPGPSMAFDPRHTVSDIGTPTVREKIVPVLRLVTEHSVAETRMTGARAGRGSVELVLPNVPTISREHARFAFLEGRWCVTNLGLNGLTVNGSPAASEHPLNDGDTIRWGSRADAVVSRVEIG